MCRVRDLNPRTFVTDLKTVAITNSANPTQLILKTPFKSLLAKKEIHRIREGLVTCFASQMLNGHGYGWEIGNRILKMDKGMLLVRVIEDLLHKIVKIVTGGLIRTKGKGSSKGIPAVILTNCNAIEVCIQCPQAYTKIPDGLTGKPETDIVLYRGGIGPGHFVWTYRIRML